MKISIFNGPNLNLLGTREPDIYGSNTLEEIKENCHRLCQQYGCDLDFRQTNHEGILIDWIHEIKKTSAGLILNAGGLTHTSVSLLDALKFLNIPIMEVHITQPGRREFFRQTSYISSIANSLVAGFGIKGYTLSLEFLLTEYLSLKSRADGTRYKRTG